MFKKDMEGIESSIELLSKNIKKHLIEINELLIEAGEKLTKNE